jgi:ribosomal protection tetracycline resistance protein
MTHSGYLPRQSHAHQGFAKSMSSTGSDFRNLTPLVVMSALREAGTTVHEPIHQFRLEVPATSLGAVVPTLARLRALVREQTAQAAACTLVGDIPAGNVHALRLDLPSLTGGEGLLESVFGRYEPVVGAPPTRTRTDANPLNREEYLLRIARRFA